MGGNAKTGTEQSKLKKGFGIAADILFAIFLLLCLIALFLSLGTKKDPNGAMRLFGYEMRIVESPSMEKCELTDVSGYEIKDLPVRSLIFIQTVPEDEAEAKNWYSALKVGDVLTFRYVYTRQEVITHRIVALTPNETGGYTIVLEGDNKNAEDGVLQQTIDTSLTDSPNYVIGKVTGKSLVLGYLVSALKSPLGIVLIVIVPCLIIIILEVIKIADILSAEKKRAMLAEQQKKDEVIAELERQLVEANTRRQQADGTQSAETQLDETFGEDKKE